MLGAGARIPQYLPYSPTYSDVSGTNALFAESIAHSPGGDLLNTSGAQFNPNAQVTRLTLAIALVKALGFDAEAQASGLLNPGLLDWLGIPQLARGYVSVAISKGLMSANALGLFRPTDSLTRLELARASVALLQAAR